LRVNEIIHRIKLAKELLIINSERIKERPGAIKLSNLNQQRMAIEMLKPINMFHHAVMELEKLSVIFLHPEDSIITTEQISGEWANKLNLLHQKANSSLPTLSSLYKTKDELTVSIKVPEVKRLSNLSKFIKELETCLEQMVVNDFIKGKVDLVDYDSGSLWLEICLGSIAAIKVVLLASDGYLKTKEKLLEIRKNEKSLEEMNIKSEAKKLALEDLEEQFTAHKKLIINSLIKTSEIPKSKHEDIKRLEKSIERIWKLLDDGAEIQPARIDPKKNDFQMIKPQKILKEIKSIEDGLKKKS
jgi:hypothetical protein